MHYQIPKMKESEVISKPSNAIQMPSKEQALSCRSKATHLSLVNYSLHLGPYDIPIKSNWTRSVYTYLLRKLEVLMAKIY